MAYEIVPYEPAFRSQVMALRARTWASERWGERYFAWKYERNPYLSTPLIHLALHRGDVVAVRCYYGTCWEMGDRHDRVVLPSSDDLVVAQEHRKHGVMALLVRAGIDDLARRGFDYTISSSAGRITSIALLTMGWKSAAPLEPVAYFGWRQRMHRALRDRVRGKRVVWRLALESSKDRDGSTTPFARLDRHGRRPAPGGHGVIAMASNARADAMADLHQRVGHDGRIRHVRDATYLAWRYENPLREHRFVYHEVDGRLEGYLAFARWHIYQEPMLPFTLTDWESSSPHGLEMLLRHALEHARFDKLGTWAATLSDETRAIFARAGFVPTDQDLRARGLPCLLVQKLAQRDGEWTLGGHRLLNPASWDVRILQSAHG
jgi:GNAT superfamily N-acetyltransferase